MSAAIVAAPVRPDPDSRPARGCAGLLLALFCLALPPAHAQLIPGIGTPGPPAEAPEPAAQPREEPAAVPLERIPTRMEQSRELVRGALEAARPMAAVDNARQQLEALAPTIEALGGEQLEARLAGADMRTLEGAVEQTAALRRGVTDAQAVLAPRAEGLSAWRDRLRQALQSWTLTEKALDAGELPADMRARIRAMQSALRDAGKRVGERQQEVLELQSTLTDWLAIIEGRADILEAELSRARVELFRPEHPPIWRGEAVPLDLGRSREAWRSEREALSNYLLTRPGNNWAVVVLLVFLLSAFALLARKARAWAEERPELARDLAVFRPPLAAALVLAIFLAPSIYPDAPLVLRELLGVLLILPLLRVLSVVVARSLHGAMYLVAGLYLLMRLDALLGGGSTMQRYALLALTAATAGAVVWIFRPAGPGAQLEVGRWWRAARLAARFSLLILATALLANIGGLVSLSELMTNGVIGSAFVGVVLFAGVVMARATLIALFQTRLMQHLNLVRWHAATVERRVLQLLSLLALAAWLVNTAHQFRIDALLGGMLSAILFTSATIGTISISLGDVLAFGLMIWLGLLVSRALRFVLAVDVFPRVTLPRGVPATISVLVNYTVIGIAVVLAVAAAGIRLDRFTIILGALSVGIGFGLQNIVNNFVSGLILAFERPVQSGDTVEFGARFGQVSRIGVRSSTVRTFDGAEVIVPNANLIANEVTNWTLSDQRRRMEVLVGVAYGTNPRRVLELLLNAARADERLLSNPEPSALFLGFGDSSLDFSLRAWTDTFDNYVSIKSDLTLAIHDALYANGIEIPFPQRDLHLRSVDPQAVARIGPVQSAPVGDGDASPESGS